ncbi:MAG TPA: hypothetical protein PLB02_11295 [Thermoanaerobaculia bacterium]|nr:hypothetical protein [Thermoanaerobaculia bacterium]HQR67971.1 hypothetical protein [Thermoanaerobaculia bacterium]
MTALSLLPPVLSLLVLAAHFFRAGQPALSVVSLLLVALLAVPRPWAARTLQAALLLGAAEWVRTSIFFVGIRREAGRPWGRLAAILAAVTVVTALSALVFESRRLRKRYRREAATPGG